MYPLISQYLTLRIAPVHVDETCSRKKTLGGVPQGGVLEPSLFTVFINDIVRDMPCKVQGVIYADDLFLWCSEEYLTGANYRLQQALNILEGWTKRQLVKINLRKTTYTIFSLSTKEQEVNLHIHGQTLLVKGQPQSPGAGVGGWGGGVFRQAAVMETTNRESRSQSQSAPSPLERSWQAQRGVQMCRWGGA